MFPLGSDCNPKKSAQTAYFPSRLVSCNVKSGYIVNKTLCLPLSVKHIEDTIEHQLELINEDTLPCTECQKTVVHTNIAAYLRGTSIVVRTAYTRVSGEAVVLTCSCPHVASSHTVSCLCR